jgi:hydroxypyruvate reductase
VDAGRLVARALADPDIIRALEGADAVDVIAAGKAAGVMLPAFAAAAVPARRVLGIGPARPSSLAHGIEWHDGGHPLPNEDSVAGARRALGIAVRCSARDLLVVLLSGGGSALMALPVTGVTLQEKQQTARVLMEQGADIYELNTVRKHLSAIKGGQLAAAAGGSVLTFAVSDVVGDDLSVIASGPTVPDDSTYAQALNVLGRRGGHASYPDAVVGHLRRGVAGEIAETPKTGDARLTRASAHVIGPQRGAIQGAQRAAETLGYHVLVVDEPVMGEARVAALEHVERVAIASATQPRPLCVISSGETTVTVIGTGKGGRNQEFAFALARSLSRLGRHVAAASIGTDGIDGPTDAAGAIVDPETFERAKARGVVDPDSYLHANNTYAFFDTLGDLIKTGPTSTNVGDLQVILVA